MYNRRKLQEIARETLITARANLIRDGHLQPCGLVFTSAGLTHIFPFQFGNIEQKRAIQQAFRHFLREVHAEAVVVVMESWIKMATDGPLDLTRSVSEMPGRREAIVIEAASRYGKVMILQVFIKGPEGYAFEEPVEPQAPFECQSEWLDGVWTRYRT